MVVRTVFTTASVCKQEMQQNEGIRSRDVRSCVKIRMIRHAPQACLQWNRNSSTYPKRSQSTMQSQRELLTNSLQKQ
eukprot:1007682-Amphidinium_carterae.1